MLRQQLSSGHLEIDSWIKSGALQLPLSTLLGRFWPQWTVQLNSAGQLDLNTGFLNLPISDISHTFENRLLAQSHSLELYWIRVNNVDSTIFTSWPLKFLSPANLYTNSNLYTQTCWSNQCNNCLRTERILYLYKFSLVCWGTILSARSQCPARTGPSRVFSRLRTELGPRRYITGDWIISSGDSTRVVTFKFGSRHNHGRAYWFTTKLLHIYSWNMK